MKKFERLQAVKDYLDGPFVAIDGWCIPQLWNIIQPIHLLQEAWQVSRPIAEIGVYHGKFFIGLALAKRGYGTHFAIDVFDMQRFNLDGAGQGNLQRFIGNIEKAGLTASEVETLRADSMTLAPSDVEKLLRASGGGFSLFSVDGCHMVEHTINDFELAMKLTCPEGVIFVDDYLNADWPGVHEGIAKLFATSAPRFVPLAYCCNKLFFCHISFHADYLAYLTRYLEESYPSMKKKRVRRFGYDAINIRPDLQGQEYLVLGSSQESVQAKSA